MTQAKRHHFVPQFYLRRFSGGKRSLTLLHKKSGRIIRNASIKGQCAIDNFYGWNDEIELALGKVESVAASLIETMCDTMILPDRHSAAWMILLTFLCLQSGRTSQSANDAEEMGDYLAKLMMSGKADELGINLDDFVIKQEYPVAMPLSVSSQAASNLLDLDACFLRSKTGTGFFASDNPVLFFNSQRCHIDGQGHIGLGSKGVQIFYPLSPTVCLYLYDASVYKQPTNTDARVLSVEDQVKINLLIALWPKR